MPAQWRPSTWAATNQFGEPFGLHLMDPIAAGSAAWPDRDGVDAGGPITSPVSCIADVEKNEQVVPLFYFHRRLARDTGGAGKYRGGLSAEVSLTLGGIDKAMALVMTHGVEVPNSHGLAGGFPGATIRQTWGKGAAKDGRLVDGDMAGVSAQARPDADDQSRRVRRVLAGRWRLWRSARTRRRRPWREMSPRARCRSRPPRRSMAWSVAMASISRRRKRGATAMRRERVGGAVRE